VSRRRAENAIHVLVIQFFVFCVELVQGLQATFESFGVLGEKVKTKSPIPRDK